MLTETATLAVNASDLLMHLLRAEDEEKKADLIQQIKEVELQGDKISGKIFKKLEQTFITPFDREDIHAITSEMEDVIDAANKCSQKISLYTPEMLPEGAKRLSEIINEEAKELLEAIIALKNLKKNSIPIKEHCKAIKKLEEDADTEYQNAIIHIFRSNISTIEVVKIKEIIQELEKTANRIYSCAKILKIIIVKYS
jgi:hypothetical protein